MKRGREIYQRLAAADAGSLASEAAKLKGTDLAALLNHADGLPESEQLDEVIGVALLIGAQRYFAKVGQKAAKRKRRARKVL